jgi:hypothetical protein
MLNLKYDSIGHEIGSRDSVATFGHRSEGHSKEATVRWALAVRHGGCPRDAPTATLHSLCGANDRFL